jgi:DNA-binding transcriptional MerR regulator
MLFQILNFRKDGKKMNEKDIVQGYLTIKEFAEFVGMTIAALRHYDKKGVFRPAKLGKEFENKYRYYSPMQITTVKMVRVLAEIGVPLQTIKELAENRTPEKLMKLLTKYKGIVADEIHFLQEVYTVISTFLELITAGMSAMENELSVSEMPERRIILGKTTDFSGSTGFFSEFTSFCNAPHEPKLNLSYPAGGYFDSMDVFLSEPSQPTRFFSLDPKGYEKIPAGLYLIGYSRGYYGQTNDLPKRMATFAKKNGLIFNGAVFNLYLLDEISVADQDQYLLQVLVPVKETRRLPSRRPIHRK